MTYKDGVSLTRIRYDRYNYKNQLPKLTDIDVLIEMSVVQARLQNTLYLVTKSSQDNSTPQLTLTVGTDIYSAGTTAGTIPTDLYQIWDVKLNDNLATSLTPYGEIGNRDTVKATGRPFYYTLYKQNGLMKFELDTLPDIAYVVSILYIPQYEHFYPSNTNNPTWSDYDITASGWGGSFKLPMAWDGLLVDGAVAQLTNDKSLLEIFEMNVERMRKTIPIHSGKEIPFDDGVNYEGKRRILVPGQDTFTDRHW